eukprot:273273_1
MEAQPDSAMTNEEKYFEWTALKIFWAIGVFVTAGVAEIVGGWMVWSSIRGSSAASGSDSDSGFNQTTKKPFYYAILGSLILVSYGFIPCLHPTDSFGRIYAIYGGFFIVMSFLFGWWLDGDKPDLGDIIGGSIALIGVLVIMLWPRK